MTRGFADQGNLILLIQEDPAEAVLTLAAVEEPGAGSFRCQSVERLSTALARIAGGDVDLVLLDLSSNGEPGGDRLGGFLKLHREAPDTPIVVLCSAQDEGLGLKAMRAGAADYLIKEQLGDGLGRAVRTAIELGANRKPARRAGEILTLLGAKGGAGTTTVALNVASVLAQQRHKVTLVEMQPAFGTLSQYFRPPNLSRNLSHLLAVAPAAIGSAEAEACLWPCEGVPGLSVLFGPQTATECQEIGPDHVQAILKTLAANADYVVVDLPPSLSQANRAAVANSGILALVVERDPVCVQSAVRMSRAMESWSAPPPTGAVVVSRAPLHFPMSVAEIDKQLGSPSLGAIPSEADLCQSAQNASTPLVTFAPESSVAESLIALAERLSSSRQWPAGAV
jgi:pilus assembly protein CpaE